MELILKIGTLINSLAKSLKGYGTGKVMCEDVIEFGTI